MKNTISHSISQPLLPGYIRLSNGKVRARPGMGKRPWGLSPGAFNYVRDEDADLRCAIRSLAKYIRYLAAEQVDLARDGYKDEARWWAHAYQFSGIHRIFEDSRYGITVDELFDLNRAVSRVIWAAYPDECPDFRGDLHAIRFYLRAIYQTLVPSRRRVRQDYFRFNRKQVRLVRTVKPPRHDFSKISLGKRGRR